MSTLIEIEAAADTLPMDEKVELVRFLTSRIQSPGNRISSQPKSLLGAWQGLVTFNEGWEEPLDTILPLIRMAWLGCGD